MVGGLIVAAVAGLATLIPKLRRPMWRAFKGAWAFIISLRVTTTTQIEAGKEAARQDGQDAWLEAIGVTAGDPSQTLKDVLLPGLPDSHQADRSIPPQKLLTFGDIIDQNVRKARGGRSPYVGDPPAPPEPVSWSARLRGGELTLTNLSKDTAALLVEASSGVLKLTSLGNVEGNWGLPGNRASWDKIGPKETVTVTALRMSSSRTLKTHLRVVWEDEDRRAHQETVLIAGA